MSCEKIRSDMSFPFLNLEHTSSFGHFTEYVLLHLLFYSLISKADSHLP